MADISKCKGINCPLKETCYRFTAIANPYRQSWFAPPVVDGKCDKYWEDDKNPVRYDKPKKR